MGNAVRSVCAATIAFGLTSIEPSAAQTIRSFCSAAQKPVSEDNKLSTAVRAVFGDVRFTSWAGECIYPLKAFRYADADVLLTLGNVPGEACHGCSAHLSAYVLRRSGGDLKLAAKFIDFAEAGTFGSPGDISQIELDGDDGFAIESGGTFQGYSFTNLDLYVFKNGKAVHLKPDTRLVLSADNGGAVVDPRKEITVDGTWAVDRTSKSRINVDYKIKKRGRTSVRHTVWAVSGDRLQLEVGTVPPEAIEAGGGL